MLSVIVGANGYDDLAARTEYLDRIHGMDEAVVGRVRDLRDQVKRTVGRLRDGQGPDRSRARRDRRRRASAGDARAALQQPPAALVARPRRPRCGAEARSAQHEEELDGDVAAIQGKIAAQLAGDRLGAAAGRADPGRQRQRPDLAGRRPGRLRLRLAHDQRQLRVPPGDRHRGARGHADPRRRRRHRDLHRSRRPSSGGYGNYTCIDHGGGLSTCYAHQSSFAVSLGQSVSQGDIIGYTGCTGYCLGPHLHFEVRINGSVTDPMGYL